MLIIIGIVIIGIIAWGIGTYNSLVTITERVENAKAQIATQIESRWDAVKTLIDATKKYSKHEAELLENVTEKRSLIGKNTSIKDIESSEAELNNVIGRLIAVSENYPDLKASSVYENTMNSINKFEDYVRNARMIYNDTVTKLNRQIKIFPSSIVANIFNFDEREYFEGTESKKDMPIWE